MFCLSGAQRPKVYYIPFLAGDVASEVLRLPYLETNCRKGTFGDNRDYCQDPRVASNAGIDWGLVNWRSAHCEHMFANIRQQNS